MNGTGPQHNALSAVPPVALASLSTEPVLRIRGRPIMLVQVTGLAAMRSGPLVGRDLAGCVVNPLRERRPRRFQL